MKKMLSALLAGSLLCFNVSAAYADPPMSAFYDGVMKMAPQGKLGQVIAKEQIATSSRALRHGKLPTFHLMWRGATRLPRG